MPAKELDHTGITSFPIPSPGMSPTETLGLQLAPDLFRHKHLPILNVLAAILILNSASVKSIYHVGRSSLHVLWWDGASKKLKVVEDIPLFMILATLRK
jgi:hypothetical protein